MSIFSDYKVGAINDYEFKESCKQMNRQDRNELDIIWFEDVVDDEQEENEDE